MALELTNAERALLREILEQELGRLKAEINRTETTSFRDELKEREDHLAAIIRRLGGDAPPPEA